MASRFTEKGSCGKRVYMKRPWYSLSESTHAYLHNCYNILVRAIATAISVSVLLGLGLVLNWVIHESLEQVGASTSTQDTLSVILVGSVVAMAVGIALINVADILSLVLANFRSVKQDSEEVKDG